MGAGARIIFAFVAAASFAGSASAQCVGSCTTGVAYAPGDGTPNVAQLQIPVTATVAAPCGFATAPSGTHNEPNFDNHAWQHDFGFTINCSVASRVGNPVLYGAEHPFGATRRMSSPTSFTERAKATTGYLPDHPFLYDKLTGLELLRFVGGLYGIERRECEARSQELLCDFALAERAHELVETYSHGMKQRLALAAALIHRPEILVLDEPMVGLDPQGALDFRRLLRRLGETGVTIFISTHSLAVAEEICDRFGILDRGRLMALGDLTELRARAARGPSNGNASDEGDGSSLESVFLRLVGAADGEW